MPLIRFRKSSALLHPVLLTVCLWLSITVLYSLHLSEWLAFSTAEAIYITAAIVLPTMIVSLLYHAIYVVRHNGYQQSPEITREIPLGVIESRVQFWTKVWWGLAIAETIVSGGIPLMWSLSGSAKNYFEYGIPSLHGAVNSLLLSLCLIRFMLYLVTRNKKHLLIPLSSIVWWMVIFTRGTAFFESVELLFIFLRFKGIRTKTVWKTSAIALSFVLLFGVLGDLRTGREYFLRVARPSRSYPTNFPSGFLWTYIYATTPLNNLLSTVHTRKPSMDWKWPATATTLFPSVLRELVYGGSAADLTSGELESANFNVSTAYVGPYQDFGILGIAIYSGLTGLLVQIFWHRRGLLNIGTYSVFALGLFLTPLFNVLMTLPILGQLAWLWIILRPQAAKGASRLHESCGNAAILIGNDTLAATRLDL